MRAEQYVTVWGYNTRPALSIVLIFSSFLVLVAASLKAHVNDIQRGSAQMPFAKLPMISTLVETLGIIKIFKNFLQILKQLHIRYYKIVLQAVHSLGVT